MTDRNMLRSVRQIISNRIEQAGLPPQAKLIAATDRQGLPDSSVEPMEAVKLAFLWLCQAQDATPDGGVSRDHSLIKGWATSYPETTGYIIPTFFECSNLDGFSGAKERAGRMLDWLVSIQFEDGGFQGGKADAEPLVPVTFNTGQILIGLAAGTRELGEPYRASMLKAASWLRDSLDDDGCWRRHPTPFAAPGEKAYETHVSWGLYEAARLAPEEGFQEAADRNIYWALSKQKSNGWFEDCCLKRPEAPLTHTLGYVLRGIIEAYDFNQNSDYLTAAQTTAKGLLGVLEKNGFLPGRLTSDWTPAVDWACLTGTVQIAHCWLRLYEITGNQAYLHAGISANHYVRRTLITQGDPSLVGGIRGSFPINGEYGRFEFLNWAAKFFIDSHLKQLEIESQSQSSKAEK